MQRKSISCYNLIHHKSKDLSTEFADVFRGDRDQPWLENWNQSSLDTLIFNMQESRIFWKQDLDTPMGLFHIKVFSDK